MVRTATALALAPPRPADGSGRRPRLALYSHDTMGLGHRRRSLLVAQALAASAMAPVTLTISGMSDFGGPMAIPPGVDSLVLPALSKIGGSYQARRLDLSLDELVDIRAGAIAAALQSFDPDLLIVDNVPRGAVGELDRALAALRARGRARCVLGLRDVLDEPATVRREWRDRRSEETIRRWYDEVWVYGDPAVYDLTTEYDLTPDIASRVRFTGYLDPRTRYTPSDSDRVADRQLQGVPDGHQLVLCLVGGGEDGGVLAEAFAGTPLPARTTGIVVTGPYMPDGVRRRVRAAATLHGSMRVVDALEEPTHLLRRADRVVMMGGYNTTCEALAYQRPALIVPRVTPRREQLIRAERLRALGHVDMLHPDELSSSALRDWLCRPVPSGRIGQGIDMDGLPRLVELAGDLLSEAGAGRQPALAGGWA